MKKLLVGSVVAAVLLIGGMVAAHSIESYLDRLQDRLELSDEQKDSLREIFEESEEKTVALQKQLRTVRNETREKFEAVLNEEQLKELNEMHNNRREGNGRHHRNGRRGHHWGYLKDGHQELMPVDYGFQAFPQFLDTDSNSARKDI